MKITLDKDGKLAHVWLPNVHSSIPKEAIDLPESTVKTLLNNRDTKAYINGGVVDILAEFSFASAFSDKNAEIRSGFISAMTPITSNYTAEDIASFSTQQAEAKAWEADNNAETPLLDFMVANRPSVDKATLVSRILANSVIYKQIAGPAIGKKQHFEDLLYALKARHEDPNQPDATQADFDAIVVSFS